MKMTKMLKKCWLSVKLNEMNVEKMSRFDVIHKLFQLDLVNGDTNGCVSYSEFKNRASIMRYGKQNKNQLKIVFVGFPKENLFGFYVQCDTDPKCMKQAYEWYCKLIKGKLDFDDVDIHFGNCGFPITYGYIRYIE